MTTEDKTLETTQETTPNPTPDTPKVETPKEATEQPKSEPTSDTKGKIDVDDLGKVLNQFAELMGKTQPKPKLEPESKPTEKPTEETHKETKQETTEAKPLIDPKEAVETLIKIYKVPPQLAPTVRLMSPENAAKYVNSEDYTKFLEAVETQKVNTEKRGEAAPKDTDKVIPRKTFKDLNSEFVGDAFKDCVK